MRIITLIDYEEVDRDDPQFEDHSRTVNRSMEFEVVTALRSLKHEVRVLPFGPDVQETIRQLCNSGAHLIFNLTEQVKGDRCKDINVASLLELLDIPYTGSSPIGLMITRDKAMSKHILQHHGIPVPDYVSLPIGVTKLNKPLRFPLIIKPQMADGSDGITARSLIRNKSSLETRVRALHVLLKQPVICEEFIAGREMKVFILGNKKLQVLPTGEIVFGDTRKGSPTFCTAKLKTDPKYRQAWQVSYMAANLPREMEARVASISKRIYSLLSIRDYGRLDFRLTADGELYFLEANANPAIRPFGFGGISSWAGVDYLYLIDEIIKLALQRQ